ncbi:MAG: hypothetical protein PHO14_04475 [Kiritimatiellae bacterium]|nr:hypothetical protein [Kiritimatiellia bacterium]
MNRLVIDKRQLSAFAAFLKQSPAAAPFDFCTRSEGFIYPRRDQDGVRETFFFSCAHQFGFWTLDGDRWKAPMIARIDGHDLKGSDYLFRACTRASQHNPSVFLPTTLAAMSDAQLAGLFQDDAGHNPLPMWPEHLALIHGYAQWFVQHDTSPAQVLQDVAASPTPLHALLHVLADIPGYAEDPLQKKSMLLAITLENRPEHFLHVTDPESAIPIIDYHLQRSALRTELVRVIDPALRRSLIARRQLPPRDEELIRAATYEAVACLMAQSGLSAAAVDWFFFQNRTRCPETTAPDCPACPVQAICAQETDLFHPVFRTTAY